MDIKPRQCIAALNAHVRSGFPLVGDAETSVYAKDIIETIQRLVLKLNEANKAYEASEVDSGFEALTAYHHGRQDGFEAAQPKWISVEERLPGDPLDGVGDVVELLIDKGDAKEVLPGYYDHEEKDWVIFFGDISGAYLRKHFQWWRVIKWREMPEAPKEET